MAELLELQSYLQTIKPEEVELTEESIKKVLVQAGRERKYLLFPYQNSPFLFFSHYLVDEDGFVKAELKLNTSVSWEAEFDGNTVVYRPYCTEVYFRTVRSFMI